MIGCPYAWEGDQIMRMMVQFSIPVETGNEAARTGALGAEIKKIIEAVKPEAAYFLAGTAGERGGFMVFDMKDTSEIPSIAEPLFLAFNAKVNFYPVMSAEDLAKAIPSIEAAVKAQGAAGSA